MCSFHLVTLAKHLGVAGQAFGEVPMVPAVSKGKEHKGRDEEARLVLILRQLVSLAS